MELLAGPTSNSVTTPVVTLLLSQTFSTSVSSLGSIQPALGDITSSGGDIMDLSGDAYNVPASNQWYQVLAWTGNYNSYAAAQNSGSAFFGSSH